MLLLMTVALIHNANVPLTLCRGTQNLSRYKLILCVPLVGDRQSGSEKRIVHDYKRVSNRQAYTQKKRAPGMTATRTPFFVGSDLGK